MKTTVPRLLDPVIRSVTPPAAQVDPKWEAGPRVRIDTMRKGDVFTDICGDVWTYVRRDGVSSGVCHVMSPGGVVTCFAGCAEGMKVRL